MNFTKRLSAPGTPMLIVWASVLFGATASIFVRNSTCPVLVLAAWRKTIVTLMLLPFVLKSHREELKALPRRLLLLSMLSGALLGLHFWSYFSSVQLTTIMASQTLTCLEVLFVAAFMIFTGREKPLPRSLFAIGAAFFGAVLIAFNGKAGPAGNAVLGDICALCAAILLAAYGLIGMKVRPHCSNTLYTFLAYGTAALVLDLLVPVCGYDYTGYPLSDLLMALCLAIFCSLLSHSLRNWAVKYVSPTVISLCGLTSPLFGTLFSLALFAEFPSAGQLLGGAIVLGGTFLYITGKR